MIGCLAAVVLLGVLRIALGEQRAHWSSASLVFMLSGTAALYLFAWGLGRAGAARPRASKYCPQLVGIAAAAAKKCGVRAPTTVGIHSHPVVKVTVHSFPRRRVVLEVGLPLLLALSGDELRTVIAHELAATAEPHPGPAVAVAAGRRRVSGAPEALAAGKQGGFLVRAAKFVEYTAGFAGDLESRADKAAVRSAGSRELAARALLMQDLAVISFAQYASAFDHLVERSRRIPAGLYSGWRPSSDSTYFLPEDRRSLVSSATVRSRGDHPDLAEAFDPDSGLLSDLGARPFLSAIDPKAERSLACALGKSRLGGNNRTVKGLAWEEIDPEQVFGPPALFDPITKAAAAVLGRSATAVDVMELLAGPGRSSLAEELVKQDGQSGAGVGVEGTPEEPLRPGVAGAAALSFALRSRGYAYLDVLHPEDLTAPDGTSVDVNAAVTDALTSTEGLDRLRLLLASTSEPDAVPTAP